MSDPYPHSSHASQVKTLIDRAREGSGGALNELFEECRQYLLGIANAELHPLLKPKVAGSDIVQETLVEAFRDFGKFRGEDEGRLKAWLREILLNNMANIERTYFGTAKRDLAREVRLDHGSAPDAGAALEVTADYTPGREAMRNEERELLTAAMERLPPPLRDVIALHHQEGLNFSQVAERMGRSPDAVRKLWVRAVKALQQNLGYSDEPRARE